MKIIIDDTKVNTKTGTTTKGQPYTIRSQIAYVDLGKRYPAEIKIRLEGEQPPFQPGDYDIDLNESVYVSKYGSLAMSEELKLVPVAVAKKAP
jgi:hypothetical protein